MSNDNTAAKSAARVSDIGEQGAKTWPIPVLKEGTHYYMEDGFMVFTEAYHTARGRCCGNACRHCPFEHKNVRR